MDYDHILIQIQEFIHNFFNTHSDPRLIYHNKEHTERVISAAKKIADHYQLSEKDYFIVMAAAWFHDIGYFINPVQHEKEGAMMAADFLQSHQVEKDDISAIKGCILATKMPQSPKSLLEQIVCDADLFHLGTESFMETNKAMRKEVEALKNIDISKSNWRNNAINLLEQHTYQTDYAKLFLEEGKKKNLALLKEKEKEKIIPVSLPTLTPETTEVKETQEFKKDKSKPDRGIETMFRITSNNNQRLSDMADNKAHIMITVNSIILSAVISILLRKIDAHDNLAIPTYLILGVSVATIIFSILATRPSIPGGKFTQKDLDDKKVNLLFFGNFYKMSLNDYSEGMLKVMADRDFLYGSLIKDVYSQGIVLGRKYRLLRISYNIFMFGLIISVLAFIIASVISID